MSTKYDRLNLRNQFSSVGCSKQSALGLAETVVGIKEELVTMMTDIQLNMLTEFRRDSELRLAEQRRESDLVSKNFDKLTGDIDKRMRKDTFSIIASILLAGIAIGLAIYFK